jgi:predicted transcriptional regulator
LSVTADGPFTFATEIAEGSAYAVTVSSQPTGQTCTVTNGSGTVGMADVTDVTVTCVIVPTYSVGGTVSGLTGTGLILLNNGTDPLSVTTDGPFTFATEIAEGSTYAITIASYPTGQTCAIINGSGTVGMAEVTDVVVTCEDGIPPSLDSDIGIPTMSAWALILLSMLFGLMAFLNRRRLF